MKRSTWGLVEQRRDLLEVRERLGDDDALGINAEVQLPPPANALPTVFCGGPLPLADDRQARAVHDEMERAGLALRAQGNVEILPATRECGVVGSRQVEVHQLQQRAEEALGLAQRQVEEQAQCHRGFDSEVGVPPLGAPPAVIRRRP